MTRAPAAACLVLLLAACDAFPGKRPSTPVAGGDARVGRALIREYGCGGCHTIPGVRGAHATAAPPLDRFARRAYIAGAVTNNPENLMAWLVNPHSIEPGTAMPVLGVTAEEAPHIAAYLYSLH